MNQLRLGLFVIFLALVLPACGSDDDDQGGGGESGEATDAGIPDGAISSCQTHCWSADECTKYDCICPDFSKASGRLCLFACCQGLELTCASACGLFTIE